MMDQHEYGDAFDFLDGSGGRPIDPRPGPAPRPEPAPRRRRRLPRALVPAAGILLHGTLLLFFLNFAGIVSIPRLERLTRERLFGVHPPAPVVAAPPARPARVAPPRPGPIPPPPAAPVAIAVAAPPRAAAQPAPVGAAPSGIDEAKTLLASKALVPTGSGYQFRSEAAVRAKLAQLQASGKRFNAAHLLLEQMTRNRNLIAQCDAEIGNTNATITRCNVAMDQYPTLRVRGIIMHGLNNVQQAEYAEFKATRDASILHRTDVTQRRDGLRREVDQAGGFARTQGEVVRLRREGLTALEATREAIEAFRREFVEAAGAADVARALAHVGQDMLRPSRELVAAVREFGVYERSASLDATFPESAWPAAWRDPR